MSRWWIAGALGLPALTAAIVAVGYVTAVYPPVPFALAAVAIFGFYAFARPYGAILITFFVIPFEKLTVLVPPDSYGSGGPLNYITLVKLMFAAIILTGLLRMLVVKEERPLRNLWVTPIPILLLAFAFLLWMSLANARRLPAFVLNMMSIESGVVAFLILINLLTTKERLYRFLKVVFFSYIFIALIGMYEAVTQTHILKLLGFPMIERPWTQNKDAFRICGPSGDPDYYAISIIFGLMITFAVLPLFRSLLARAFVLAVTVLHFLAIVATASRGAAISTAVALFLLYVFARMRHKFLVGAAAVLILGGGFLGFTLTVSSRAAARYTTGDTSSWEERWGWIQMCYAMMLDAPVRGVGSGQFIPLYPRYMKTYSVPRKPESAQNTYAVMAAQNGIPTTLVYLLANVILWIVLYKVMRGTRDPVLEYMAASFFALAFSFWLFSLTLDLVESEISWIIFAMGVILWRLLKDEQAARVVTDQAVTTTGGGRGVPRWLGIAAAGAGG